MVNKLLIWGAGNTAKKFIDLIDKKNNTILAVVDNNSKIQGGGITGPAL